MITSLGRLIYRHLSDKDYLKELVGRDTVETVKDLINADNLTTAKPFREVFPQADVKEILEEDKIEYDNLSPLKIRQESRINTNEKVYNRPRIFASTAENALICPQNNVVMNQKREVAKESINMRGRTVFGLDRKALCRSRVDTIDGPATLLRGPAIGYWHAQLDNLPRLSLLHQDHYRALPEIKLLRPKGGPPINVELEDYLVPKIAPSNCKIVEVPIDRLYTVENYLFTSFLTYPFSAYLPDLYHDLLDSSVLPDRERARSERIFISREKASRRSVTNEEEVFSVLKNYGFELYHLEEMHIREKIDLFYDAEAVVSPTSSGLASLLYTSNIPVIELFPMPQITHPANYFLSKSVNNNHHYVTHNGGSLTSDFEADIEELKATIDSLLSS